MNRLSDEQVRSGFRMLGLETEQARAEFTRFVPPPSPDEQQEFTRLDSTTQLPEADHAELA